MTQGTHIPSATKPEAPGYQFVRLLAKGGMAEIWSAEVNEPPPGASKPFFRVVKILNLREMAATTPTEYVSEIVRRFREERKAFTSNPHPNLLPYFSFGELSNDYASAPEHGFAHSYYNVLEYVNGLPLDEYVRQRAWPGAPPGDAPLDSPDALRRFVRLIAFLGQQIAEALGTLHNDGILHRDISPDNILILSDPSLIKLPRAFLIDFGIAKLPGTSGSRSDYYAGKLEYRAPELTKLNEATSASDTFALARSLRKVVSSALTGGEGNAQTDLISQWRTKHTLPSDSQLESLENLLSRAGALSLDERCSASQLASELKTICRALNLHASTPAEDTGILFVKAFVAWESNEKSFIDDARINSFMQWAETWPLTSGEFAFLASLTRNLSNERAQLAQRASILDGSRRLYRTIVFAATGGLVALGGLGIFAWTQYTAASRAQLQLEANIDFLREKTRELEEEKRLRDNAVKQNEELQKARDSAVALQQDVASGKQRCDVALSNALNLQQSYLGQFLSCKDEADNCKRPACMMRSTCADEKAQCNAPCIRRAACDDEKKDLLTREACNKEKEGTLTRAACNDEKKDLLTREACNKEKAECACPQ